MGGGRVKKKTKRGKDRGEAGGVPHGTKKIYGGNNQYVPLPAKTYENAELIYTGEGRKKGRRQASEGKLWTGIYSLQVFPNDN